MPRQFSSYLGSLALATGKTKSKLMRDIFAYWQSNDPTAKSESDIVKLLSNKYNSEWNMKRAGTAKTEIKTSLEEFCKQAHDRMTEKGVDLRIINHVISKIKENENC